MKKKEYKNKDNKPKKEEKLVFEGLVTKSFRDGMFEVCLNDNDTIINNNTSKILGYISGKIRCAFIKILCGDRVKIEVSKYDSTRGRIIYRIDHDEASENPDKASENPDKASENPDKASENPNKDSEN